MKAIQFLLLCVAPSFAFPVCLAQAKDAPGCKDSPLIARYPGTSFNECKDSANDAYTFHNIGPKGEDKKLEGEYHYIVYDIPDSISPAQITRNLTTAFRNAGYTFVQDDKNGHFTVHMGRPGFGKT